VGTEGDRHKEKKQMFGIGRTAALTATAAIFGSALLGGVALAAFTPVGDLAQATLGASANAPDRGDKLKAVLDALVQKNVITQAQEDAIVAAFKDATDRTHEEFLRRVLQDLMSESATYLGMTAADLRAKLPGTSLGAIADATPGKSKAGLVQDLTRFVNDAIDKAVANGKLTKAQADKAKPLVSEHVNKFVDQTFPKKQPRPALPKLPRPSGTKAPTATR
jgi:polyhydroxyalkanoate synthesis regulator phasin